MGFGFNLALIFIILPLTILLLVLGTITQRLFYLKLMGIIWAGVITIALLGSIKESVFGKIKLDKDDYYGTYIINRDYFEGVQTDWQYNHFRFEITENDSIFFYITDYDKIQKIYRGSISTAKPYNSERLVILMEQPTHHILNTNPTIYRNTWNFYLVFNSPKFHNVFFKKGKWKPLD